MFNDEPEKAFGQLLQMIRRYAAAGLTVDLRHYEEYFKEPDPERRGIRIASRVMVKKDE